MSILPLYLSSFSNVSALQRGSVERLSSGQVDGVENAGKTDATRKTGRENDDDSTRSYDGLIVRSGDVVSNDGDVFSLSREAKQPTMQTVAESKDDQNRESTQVQNSKADTTDDLSQEERQEVSELKQRDAEVKAHEAAHLAAAGGLARGGASYEYQEGPDGNRYAVGGEVTIDTSSVKGDPESTLAKAKQIRNAALAPANPSSQDYMVAAKANQMETQARKELAEQQQTSQDSQQVNSSQTEKDAKNQSVDFASQQVSQSVVAKYAMQSQSLTFRSQTAFQAIA